MIEWLSGIVVRKQPGHLILNVAGIGYGIDLTSRAFDAAGSEGDNATLVIRHIVREDDERLIGFASFAERDAFDLLLLVQGIGPRTALDALSTLGLERLVLAISEKEVNTLVRIPGVGKKTAERMVLELASKVEVLRIEVGAALTTPGVATTSSLNTENIPSVREAMAALEALGCKPQVARRAALKALEILGPKAPVTDLIREGLKHRHA